MTMKDYFFLIIGPRQSAISFRWLLWLRNDFSIPRAPENKFEHDCPYHSVRFNSNAILPINDQAMVMGWFLLYFIVVLIILNFSSVYLSGFFNRHCEICMIAPMPVKQHWKLWARKYYTSTNVPNKTKVNTKKCAYLLGHNVCDHQS